MRKMTSLILLLPLLLACQKPELESLKNRFQEDFFIGAAVNLAQVTGREVGADSLLELHFSSITSENGLKWGPVHPKEGEYNFEFGDAYVAMGEKMGAFTIGHTL
jgi:endo-1,4-beta-xylanase